MARALQHQDSSQCVAIAVISGRLSDQESHAHIHVIVTDENDNAPELVYPEEPRVCENAAPGKVRQEEGSSLSTDGLAAQFPSLWAFKPYIMYASKHVQYELWALPTRLQSKATLHSKS